MNQRTTARELKENKPLYNSKEVQFALGNISNPTLYRYIKRGILHKPLKPSERCSFWKAEWIEEAIKNMEEISQQLEAKIAKSA